MTVSMLVTRKTTIGERETQETVSVLIPLNELTVRLIEVLNVLRMEPPDPTE